jgi:phospholipase/carboxylesterase
MPTFEPVGCRVRVVQQLRIVGFIAGFAGFTAGALTGSALAAASKEPLSSKPLVVGGSGPPTLVLLHGYGCSALAWQPFTKTIALPAGGRFIFPEAPLTVSADRPDTQRAWCRFELPSHGQEGDASDLSWAQCPGIRTAAANLRALLQQIEQPGARPVLGGFSQGAMVASEVAFTSSQPLAALVILSGSTVDESRWRPGLARRAGLRVFISHGRSDTTFSFARAARFAAELEAAGLNVTWMPFDGGHEIPAVVVVALNHFLAGVSPEWITPEARTASARPDPTTSCATPGSTR